VVARWIPPVHVLLRPVRGRGSPNRVRRPPSAVEIPVVLRRTPAAVIWVWRWWGAPASAPAVPAAPLPASLVRHFLVGACWSAAAASLGPHRRARVRTRSATYACALLLCFDVQQDGEAATPLAGELWFSMTSTRLPSARCLVVLIDRESRDHQVWVLWAP